MPQDRAVVCSSASMLGVIAAAWAGLAAAGLVESCVPPGLMPVGEAEGLSTLPMFDLSLVPGPGEPSRLAARLRDVLLWELSSGQTGAEQERQALGARIIFRAAPDRTMLPPRAGPVPGPQDGAPNRQGRRPMTPVEFGGSACSMTSSAWIASRAYISRRAPEGPGRNWTR
ncbi:hypothetical protein [Rubellimicrobium arenae]|uniref:hypothetical protein n=1 Tax=Rubellimicrobium arenae TaxID=2817372 RepID=UPI001B30629E|nr:hypothetical protein [Rubellimicrobium arenae]